MAAMRRSSLSTAVVAALLTAACSSPPPEPEPESTSPDTAPAEVQAVSLLGEELPTPELPDEFRQQQLELLAEAEAALEADPDDPESMIWVGRRTAYLGRYREAIDVFTEGIERHPDDPRLYRHRGHRYITTRRLDHAIEDLSHAAELVRDRPDEIEPDGLPNERGIPTSTLKSNIFYHLGLAHYLNGDLEPALAAYENCLEVSTTPDNVVATSHWLYMTLRRLGRAAAAAAVLEPITEDLDIIENHDYYRLLLLYKGAIEPAAMEQDLWADHGSLGMATVGYGVGNWHFYGGSGGEGGDRERGLSLFGEVLSTGQWPAFGYIAAEAELARLEEPEREVFLWRGKRLARLAAEDGWMSLVGLFPLAEGEYSFGTDPSADFVFPVEHRLAGEEATGDGPAEDEPAEGGSPGDRPEREPAVFGTLTVTGGESPSAHLRASPEVTILADGAPVDDADLASDAEEETTYLEVEPYRFFVIERSGRLYLRVLDLSLPGRLPRPDIPYYPVDPAWRIEARFEPYDPPRTIPVPTILETTEESISPGALVFEHDGAEHRLDAIDSGDDLFIIFADRTTGRETYGGGRYVYTELADPEGRITLDLNRAYNPPCVFTDYATCPLPPRQNRLDLTVEAGEKMIEGYVEH